MKRFWPPIIALLISAPILTELLSNNVPAPQFFEPRIFLGLATIGYGLPVLVLRELAVRWRAGVAGRIALGLVYGLYNEGLIARTLFLPVHVPIQVFDHYGFFGGINFSWAAVILVWHAFHAFLFPLLLVHAIFPAAAREPWVPARYGWVMAALLFIVASLAFFRSDPINPRPTPFLYVGLLAAMAALVFWARHLPVETAPSSTPIRIWLAGLSGMVFVVSFFLLPILWAHFQVHPMFYFIYVVANLAVALVLLQRKGTMPALLFFGLGAELTTALFCLAGAIGHGSLVNLITDLIFCGLFISAFGALRRPGRLGQGQAG